MEETKMTEMAVDAWVRELKNSVETGKITIEYDSDGVDVTSSLGKYKSGVTSKRVNYLIDSIVDHFIKNYDFVIVKLEWDTTKFSRSITTPITSSNPNWF